VGLENVVKLAQALSVCGKDRVSSINAPADHTAGHSRTHEVLTGPNKVLAYSLFIRYTVSILGRASVSC